MASPPRLTPEAKPTHNLYRETAVENRKYLPLSGVFGLSVLCREEDIAFVEINLLDLYPSSFIFFNLHFPTVSVIIFLIIPDYGQIRITETAYGGRQQEVI